MASSKACAALVVALSLVGCMEAPTSAPSPSQAPREPQESIFSPSWERDEISVPVWDGCNDDTADGVIARKGDTTVVHWSFISDCADMGEEVIIVRGDTISVYSW